MGAAIIAGDLLHARALAKLRGGTLESIKWFAFGAMLLDHFAAYVAGVRAPFAEFFGAMVFPLFAFALAVGVAGFNIDRREQLLARMLGWALVAQACALLVPLREVLPLNVLCTFAAALFLDLARDKAYLGWERLTLGAAGALLAYCAEFSFPGVAIAYGMLRWAREGDARWLLLVAGAQALVTAADGTLGAWLAPCVVLVAAWAKPTTVRIPGVFYPAYAGQFALVAALHWVLM